MATISRWIDQAEMTQTHDIASLGDGGVTYVANVLAAGNSLSRRIAETATFNAERCCSKLPPSVSLDRAMRLEESVGGDPGAAEEWLASIIQEYLSESYDRIVIVEDALSRRGDSVLERMQAPLMYFGDEVYRVLDQSSASDYAIRTTIAEADAPHSLICVFSSAAEEGDEGSVEIGCEMLDRWAVSARGVAVKAHDGETFVVAEIDELPVSTSS